MYSETKPLDNLCVPSTKRLGTIIVLFPQQLCMKFRHFTYCPKTKLEIIELLLKIAPP